jgi:hypothetical protein
MCLFANNSFFGVILKSILNMNIEVPVVTFLSLVQTYIIGYFCC